MKRSFGFWLTAIFIVSTVAPLLILTTAFTLYFRNLFLRENNRMFSSTLYAVSQSVSLYAEELSRLSMLPYLDVSIMGHLANLNSGKYNVDLVATYGINNEYKQYITQQLANARSDLTGVLFAPLRDEGGTGYLVRRYSGTLDVVANLDAGASDWYRGAIEADGDIYFSPIGTPDYYDDNYTHHFYTREELNIFSIARLIKDRDTQRPIGVLKVDAVDIVLQDIVRGVPIDSGSVIMLLDSSNHIIYSSDGGMAHLAEHLAQGSERVTDQGRAYSVSVANIGSTPWRLCYFASEEEVRQRTLAIIAAAALMCLVSFAVAAVFFYGNSRRTVRAMDDILRGMQSIASGDLDVRLPRQDGAAYLDTIAEALNQTAARLESHIQREYKAVLAQRNAEYLALQSQINPHFLNNVLTGFVTLNQVGDRATLEKSILQLSHIFRYIAKNEDMSTLGDELGIVEEYLSLQKMRFGNRLHFTLHATPQAARCALPKLVLQPLVENAVIHGMEPYDFDLRIEVDAAVEAAREGSLLRISLRDDGGGFDTGGIGPESVGIGNVRDRLRLYRPGAALEIVSAPGSGCLCILTVPQPEVDPC